MSVTSVLRGAAALLGLIALAEPSWSVDRRARLPVEIRAADPSWDGLAADIRRRLGNLDAIHVDSAAEPRAVVIVGDTVSPGAVTPSVPVSLVLRTSGRNVRVRELTTDPVLIPGWTSPVHAFIEAVGMAGTTSTIVLEGHGVQLQQLEHRWTTEREIFNARFDYVPPKAGTTTLRVIARALDGEAVNDDNHADVQVAAEDRKLRVLFFEPRPSWSTAFARRAIEPAPFLEVETLAHPSRGVDARTSSAPRSLSARTLESFDAVVVAAPEELRAGDLDALDRFSLVRGGAVVLMPDRKPSGPYAQRLPARALDEVLTEKPATLQGVVPPLQCSESVVLTEPAPGSDVIATLARATGAVPVIVSWPNGAGRVIFSGCLDAWRYRSNDTAFARFWTAHIARAAAEAPRRIEVSVHPAPALPGQSVRVTARVRRTEFPLDAPRLELPSISSRVTDSRGSVMPVRLWPTSEPGVFEGSFQASAPGRHLVEVSLADSHVATKGVTVADGVRSAEPGATESLRALAAASGGVVVTAAELSTLEQHLEGSARAITSHTVHPARSPLWALAFIGLLSAEWWLRRREGRV